MCMCVEYLGKNIEYQYVMIDFLKYPLYCDINLNYKTPLKEFVLIHL